jgi:hypothetical protein
MQSATSRLLTSPARTLPDGLVVVAADLVGANLAGVM